MTLTLTLTLIMTLGRTLILTLTRIQPAPALYFAYILLPPLAPAPVTLTHLTLRITLHAPELDAPLT